MASIDPNWFTGIIDLSHHEHREIDWELLVQNGITAVMHKATEGTTFVDNSYEFRRRAAQEAGLLWGSFHFAGELDGTGRAQADHYLSVAQVQPSDFLCFDCEKHGTFDNMERFVERVAERLSRYPAIYGRRLLRELMRGNEHSIVTRGVLWYDEYPPSNVIHPRQPLPAGWSDWTLWQYTNGADGPDPKLTTGAGRVDRSAFKGSAAELRAQWPFFRAAQ